ncbi:hypothetical protein M9458_051665 [Cirrhinus mrigala]|uniref:Uncharacterized protein n=1 Tax=Cirrhinus mrigala TaxID=683832 RepID=A0ABD0MWV2_CIRMR
MRSGACGHGDRMQIYRRVETGFLFSAALPRSSALSQGRKPALQFLPPLSESSQRDGLCQLLRELTARTLAVHAPSSAPRGSLFRDSEARAVVLPSLKNHLSGRGVGFDRDAGTSVSCSDRVDPHHSQESQNRPVTRCQTVPETAVHETPAVVAQDQGVLPKGKPALHDQGHAALLTCLRHVEEILVPESGPGVGDSLSSLMLTEDASFTVPSGDRPVTPAIYGASGHSGLQRAHLAASAQVRSGAGRLAASMEVSRATRLVVPCRASVSGHRASRSSTPETIWQHLPNMSQWVLHTVEEATESSLVLVLPPPMGLPTLVGPQQALVMEQEVNTLLRKEAIEVVPPLAESLGSTAGTSLFRRKMGRGCVLDLCQLNRAVMRLRFSMTLKHPDQDAYLHVHPSSTQKVAEVRFGGKAYQYRVLPFGLALSPRTFISVLQGILNHRRFQMAVQHRDVVLTHMKELGLRLKRQEKTAYLGVVHICLLLGSKSQNRPVTRCQTVPETAVHETPAVVAQDQGVLPKGKPASHAQGHAAMLSDRCPGKRDSTPDVGQIQVDLFATLEISQFIQLPWGWMPWFRQGRSLCSRETAFHYCCMVLGPDFLPRRLSVEVPVRRDLLSQAGGKILHPHSELWKLWVLRSLRLLGPSSNPELPQHFTSCPLPIGTVLEFLQARFAAGLTHSTLKVYVAAIAAFHSRLAGQLVGNHPLVTRFLHGVLRPLASMVASKAFSSGSMPLTFVRFYDLIFMPFLAPLDTQYVTMVPRGNETLRLFAILLASLPSCRLSHHTCFYALGLPVPPPVTARCSFGLITHLFSERGSLMAISFPPGTMVTYVTWDVLPHWH